MDAEHAAHLQRILENRRRRGAFAGGGGRADTPTALRSGPRSAASPAAEVPVAAAPAALAAEPQPSPAPRASYAAEPVTARPPPPQTKPVQAPLRLSDAAPDAAQSDRELRQLVEQNRRLQQQQLLQEKRIEALQAELRSGFQGLSSTLRASLSQYNHKLHESQQGSASHHRGSDAREAPRAIGAAHAQQMAEQELFLSGAGRAYPIPQQLADAAGPSPAEPTPVLVPFRATATPFTNPRPAATHLPRRPPLGARPFTTSTIDIDSSITILRSGNWWLKWNRKGTDVQARYVWLDTEKYILSWGKQRGAVSVLSGHLNVEQITHVTTSQMVERDDDVTRVFHVLIIHTPLRQVYLATEKRDKLDTWYDALTNIAMFYRAYSNRLREEPPSSE